MRFEFGGVVVGDGENDGCPVARQARDDFGPAAGVARADGLDGVADEVGNGEDELAFVAADFHGAAGAFEPQGEATALAQSINPQQLTDAEYRLIYQITTDP